MKKIWLNTLTLLITATLAWHVMADTEVVDGITWTYTIKNGDVQIAGASPAIGALTIPSILGDYPVTGIGDYAFQYCSEVTNITIPEGVTSIGEFVFWGCSGLTNVTIPSSVTIIGRRAFRNCSALKSVIIPEGVMSIGSGAFLCCVKLENVTMPNSVTNIEKGAFMQCSELKNVHLPNTLATINEDMFIWCTSLTNIVIPSGVTSIGSSAFYGCGGLTSVTIPSSMTSIGSRAFFSCSGMTNVVFGGNAPTCGANVFDNVKSGCTATVKWGTTGWDDDGDGKWQGLTLVWRDAPMPDGGPYTETVGKIEWTFKVNGGKASVTKANPATGDVTIPFELGGCAVTSIGDDAFDQCAGLTSVTIPASVTTIGNGAFRGCTLLADVYFDGDTLSSIGVDAFRECYWDLIMHVPATWQGRGRTICGYTVLKGCMFIVK